MILATEIVLLVAFVGCLAHLTGFSAPKISGHGESVALAFVAMWRRQQLVFAVIALACLAAVVGLEVLHA